MADDLVGFDAADFLTLEHDAAASDLAILALEQTGDRVQRGGLACPVGPEKSNDASLLNLHTDAVENQEGVCAWVFCDHLCYKASSCSRRSALRSLP